MNLVPSLAFVGPGAMGTALAHAFAQRGVAVRAVAGRDSARAQRLADAIPGARVVSIAEAGKSADVVFLTVSDSAIEDVCSAIDSGAGTLVAHVSGSRDVSALDAARGRGSAVGAMHPLAAVARGELAGQRSPASYLTTFDGAAFAIEGDETVRRTLGSLARSLHGVPFAIRSEDKALYHLGASMLAAFSAGLAQIAWDQMRRAGADPAVATAGVSQLLATVADNIGRSPEPAAAQTGPVARGDARGVARQAKVAAGLSPEAFAVYRVHTAHAVALARHAGAITEETASAILGVLAESLKPDSL